jgi:hypothetical protein
VRAPIGDIDHRVEIFGEKFIGVAAKTAAVVVFVDETGGGDGGASGVMSDVLNLSLGQRSVNRQELEVLVFADKTVTL